jgi:hypothetical protein
MWRNGPRTKLRAWVLLLEILPQFHRKKHVRRARFLRRTLVLFTPRLLLLYSFPQMSRRSPRALNVQRKRRQLCARERTELVAREVDDGGG